MSEVTRILSALDRGDPHAAEQLLPLVYDELRKLAATKLAQEAPGQSLTPTALVHEAYLRLVGPADTERPARQYADQRHFFAVAAEAMRRVLVDNARRKLTGKRGGRRRRVVFDGDAPARPSEAEELLALDEALTRLAAQDPEAANVVRLCYFAGLTVAEAGASLDMSRATAYRHWQFARAWLLQEVRGAAAD